MAGVTFDARGKKADRERPRTLGTHVREARARLTGVSGGVSYDHELLTMFVTNQYRTALALPVLALIIAAYCVTWLPAVSAIMWVAMVFITQGIQLVLCREFTKREPGKPRAKVWGGKLAASEFLMSASWVALAYMIWNQMVTHEHMLVIGVLMIVSVIRMTISSTFMPIVLAGTVPITIAVAHLAVAEGDAVHYGMALFAIATELYSLQIARNLNSTARHMLDYRAQKDGLIAELEQARVNSDAARKRAEQASAAKSHFLATMSHELRTPLNAILGFSEVMKDELMGAHTIPCYREYAHDIHRSGEYLLNLINQVLDHSRVEAGRYQLHEAPVSLQILGTDCKELLLLKARKKGIALVEKYEPNLPAMLADERAIKQIWLNLISNAVKFTPRGGAITLAVGHTAAGGLYFAVHDTGPGIPADEIPRVLSSFGQGSLSYETAQEGAGLGLPIVRGLVELHGGTFTLTSTPGAGTQAHAEFPRSRIVRTATPAPHAAPPLAATG